MKLPDRIRHTLEEQPVINKEWLANLVYMENEKEPWVEVWVLDDKWWDKNVADPYGHTFVVTWWKESNMVNYYISIKTSVLLPEPIKMVDWSE